MVVCAFQPKGIVYFILDHNKKQHFPIKGFKKFLQMAEQVKNAFCSGELANIACVQEILRS